MLLNKKALVSLIALAGISSVGTISFLSNQSKEKKVKEDFQTPDIPSLSETKEEITQDLPESTNVVTENVEIQEVVKGGRIYSKEDLRAMEKRRDEDEAFGDKEGTLHWQGGNSSLSEEQKKEAKSKFQNSKLLKNLGEERELIDYTDHLGWRIKTSMYMRSDIYSPKKLHTAIEEERINLDEDEGREEYAWKLREICYKAADYINDDKRMIDTFAIHKESYDDLSVINLCTFPKEI